MLASLYRRVVHLHPPAFREKFGDEMSSIFEQAKGTPAEIRLLLDALVSLARQWGLRSEFWYAPDPAPVQPAPDGVPCFSSLDPFRPRSSAVIEGLLLSIALFCLTCFAIRYSWIHVLHVRIPEVQFERSTWRPESRPVAADFERMPIPTTLPNTSSTGLSRTNSTIEVPRQPVPAKANPRKHETPATADPAQSDSGQMDRPSNQVFQSAIQTPLALETFEGTYVVEHPRRITLVVAAENGNLTMSMEGQRKVQLIPSSSTKFTVSAMGDCWIDFMPGNNVAGNEPIRQLKFSCNGEQFIARKQSRLD